MNKKTKKRVGMLLMLVAVVMWAWDYMGTLKTQQTSLDIQNVNYYDRHYDTQGQKVSYAVYTYKGKLYFVSKCTVGEETKMQTAALNDSQQETFFAELNEKASIDIREEKNSSDSTEQWNGTAGVYAMGGYHEIMPIDQKKVGLEIALCEDSNDDVQQEYHSQNPANTEELEAVLQDEEFPVEMNGSDLQELVQQQLEETYGERMETIRVVKQNEADFEIEAVGTSQKRYKATFTTAGYMVEHDKG